MNAAFITSAEHDDGRGDQVVRASASSALVRVCREGRKEVNFRGQNVNFSTRTTTNELDESVKCVIRAW